MIKGYHEQGDLLNDLDELIFGTYKEDSIIINEEEFKASHKSVQQIMDAMDFIGEEIDHMIHKEQGLLIIKLPKNDLLIMIEHWYRADAESCGYDLLTLYVGK